MSLAHADSDSEEKNKCDRDKLCISTDFLKGFEQVLQWLNYFCKKVIELFKLLLLGVEKTRKLSYLRIINCCLKYAQGHVENGTHFHSLFCTRICQWFCIPNECSFFQQFFQ